MHLLLLHRWKEICGKTKARTGWQGHSGFLMKAWPRARMQMLGIDWAREMIVLESALA